MGKTELILYDDVIGISQKEVGKSNRGTVFPLFGGIGWLIFGLGSLIARAFTGAAVTHVCLRSGNILSLKITSTSIPTLLERCFGIFHEAHKDWAKHYSTEKAGLAAEADARKAASRTKPTLCPQLPSFVRFNLLPR